MAMRALACIGYDCRMDWVCPPLSPLAVHLWRVELQGSPAMVAENLALLSPDERQRAARLISAEHQHRFIIARGKARTILARHLGQHPAALQFTYQPRGKPDILGSPLHFNLSHSGDLALLAVSGEPIGVDLERIRPTDSNAIAEMIFSAEERAAIAAAPAHERSRRFLQTWVRREAQLKALGLGISDAPAVPSIPVYDLEMGSDFLAAVATAIQRPQILRLPAEH